MPPGTSLRAEVLRLLHDDPTAGHQGTSKTIKRLANSFFWQQMRKDVKDYVSTCPVCQRTKARQHRPYGELATLPVPTGPMQELSMDFITKLPPSLDENGKECDALLIVVDRFTKYVIYIPITEKVIVKGLVFLLFRHVFIYFRIPRGIVSDRGSLFTSYFWGVLC